MKMRKILFGNAIYLNTLSSILSSMTSLIQTLRTNILELLPGRKLQPELDSEGAISNLYSVKNQINELYEMALQFG